MWKSDDPAYPRIDVYGSLDELERDFGVRPTNLHRPYIDELTRPNPDDPTGKSTMRRIEDVFDVWFDSGSMPYAQVHYPFENQDWFETHFPGDFIVEYIGQTRGWFYTLHVLATALFDRPGVQNLCGARHRAGQRRAEDEQVAAQLPRRDRGVRPRRLRRHAVVPDGLADPARRQPDRHRAGHPRGRASGVAAVLERLHLPGAVRAQEGHLAHRFGATCWTATSWPSSPQLRDDLTESLDVCDISGACDQLRQFTEALTNWYVRRSRSRFWEEDPDAIDTLHTVLEVTGRLAAPLLPLITEVIWRGVTGERSVHLTDWPEAGVLPAGCGTGGGDGPGARSRVRRRRRCARPRSCGCGCRCRN